GTGLAASTATGTVNDDYAAVQVVIVQPGTVGVAGITFRYTLDGLVFSAETALGAASTFVIPNSGITITFGAGTFVAGDSIAFSTTGPKMTTSDLSTALEALRISSLAWEFILVDGHDATGATVTVLDTWLSAREAEGRYRAFIACAPARTPATQTEAQYLTSQATAWSVVSSIRGCVAADVGDLVSSLPGRAITQSRPAGLALAARTAKIAYGTDPALVSDGPVPGFTLSDLRGNPKNHDENIYPGLDAIRLVTLRTFDRKQGTFITNANVLSTNGSDYVWMQHIRTMNRACEIAFDSLTQQLSRAVRKSPKTGPMGEVYIAEEDAQRIEQIVNQSLSELRSQVSDLRYTLSRTDNIGSNGPAIFNGDLKLSSLAYAKEFDTNASFVRTISIAA
ncbi:MAG: hypothetical protein H0U66_04895, partial [Gemmatimonadaceae bacterium]|nr:hypothetical protein [Gemmatimonadaceae bacterium]